MPMMATKTAINTKMKKKSLVVACRESREVTALFEASSCKREGRVSGGIEK